MRRRKKRGQNCRDKTLFIIIIIIILFSSRAKRLLIIVHYVCCGDGDGSPIGKKKHYHRLLLLLLLFPRVSNVRAGERQSRRSRCVVVAVVVSGFDLSFFPFSREKPLSRLALVSLLYLYYYSGKCWLSFFLIYRAQNTFTRKKCTRSETFRRRNLSTGWASRVASRLGWAFPFLRWTFNKQKEDDLVDFCTNDNRERERQTEGIRRRVTGAAGERFKTTTVTNNSTCCNVNVPCIPWQWSRFPFSSAIVLQRREFPRAFRFFICTRNSTGY